MSDPIVRFFMTTRHQAKEAARLARNQEGASAVEYGLLVALIAVMIMTAVALVGTNMSTMFTNIAGYLD